MRPAQQRSTIDGRSRLRSPLRRRRRSSPAPASDGLAVSGVSVHFGGLTALDDVSLEVSPGEVVGVIGPNGAGKTTLFNVICGFVRPAAGSLSWRGESLAGVRPHELARLGIARTLQAVGLFPTLTVLENVLVGADRFRRTGPASALLGLPRGDRDERALREVALEALETVGIRETADRRPDSLPFAVRKRVAIARALAAKPELILFDEPASGLGSDDMAELGELIKQLGESAGVLLVEHHMDLVMSTCDAVTVLDFGRVVARGTPAEVQANPAVVDAYLGVGSSTEGGRA